MALTPDQQQSVKDSGGYYDATGNWIDMSGGGGVPPPAQGSGASSVNPWLGILAALGSAIGGRAIANNAASNNVPPELRQLLTMSVQRQAFQNPLFQAQTQGVYQMLPSFAREGTSMAGMSLPATVPPPPQDSGSNPLTSVNPLKNPLLAGGLGAALASLFGKGGPGSGSTIPLEGIAKAIKNLFSHHGSTPNGFSGPRQETDPTYFTGPVQSFEDFLNNAGLDNPEFPTGPQRPLDPSMFPGYTDPRSDPMYGGGLSGGFGVGTGEDPDNPFG